MEMIAAEESSSLMVYCYAIGGGMVAGKRITRRMEVGFPMTRKPGSLKEQLLMTTFRNVRSQGHSYVELRKEGRKSIFYCTICLAPCYNDTCLYAHLNGNPHIERLADLKDTLFKPNPWPFNDGVFFFHNDSEEKSKSLPASDSEQTKLLDIHHTDTDSLAVVKYKASAGPVASTQSEDNADCDENPCNSNLDDDGTGRQLVIPAVLQNDKRSDLVVRRIGVGKIGARFSEKDGVSSEIRRIWCEWLGNADIANDDVDEHEFAIVTFSHKSNLGRFSFSYVLQSSPRSETEDSSSSRGKKRKPFSDPEDTSEALDNRDYSSGEESQSSNKSKSKLVSSGSDDQLIYSRIISRKTTRKELRKQHHVASVRSCDLCKQKLFPNKDVAALLNRRTGKLACSSRNINGAFHIFHISCLIQWILLCEVEIFAKQSVEPKGKQKPRRKVKGKKRQKPETQHNQMNSIYCPECQGTGIGIDGNELEKPTVPLSEIFWHKIKLCDARKAWIKCPEKLDNCSLGFNFPFQSDEKHQEHVAQLKLLHFYRADG